MPKAEHFRDGFGPSDCAGFLILTPKAKQDFFPGPTAIVMGSSWPLFLIGTLLALEAGGTWAFFITGGPAWPLGHKFGRDPSAVCSFRMSGMVPPPPPPKRGVNVPAPAPRKDSVPTPEPEAGKWRDSVLGDRKIRPNPSPPGEGVGRFVRARLSTDQLRTERERREKEEARKRGPPPPPMMTQKEWEVRTPRCGWHTCVFAGDVLRPKVHDLHVFHCLRGMAGQISESCFGTRVIRGSADPLGSYGKLRGHARGRDPTKETPHFAVCVQVALRLSGAKNVQELHLQLEYAKAGDIAGLERKWMRDGASRTEIKKRVGQAMAVCMIFVRCHDLGTRMAAGWCKQNLHQLFSGRRPW